MPTLSIIIPCYNEEPTLKQCVEKVLEIQDRELSLEIIIVDDASGDNSPAISRNLKEKYAEVRLAAHDVNQGKGAALRTGFKMATGNFIAVQDADLEYNPFDLKKLLIPLINDEADVVIGSRFLTGDMHRVLYFWHYMGNRLLTFLSNMCTDLNLTDMETCYKVFKREVIQSIDIQENRFGFEPEIVAKIAHKRLRIFEAGISYHGRTYEEGKKIGIKDGFRALYCVLHYNASHAPLPVQFLFYLFIGGVAALFNLSLFLALYKIFTSTVIAAPTAFIAAAILNYLLCIKLLFRHRARWNSLTEIILFAALVSGVCLIDLAVTSALLTLSFKPWSAKVTATAVGLFLNFAGRRFLVFPEPASGPWAPQTQPRPGPTTLPDVTDGRACEQARFLRERSVVLEDKEL